METPGRGTVTDVSDLDVWRQIPDGWPAADPALIDQAKQKAREALTAVTTRSPIARLAAYYDRTGNYAGASFVDLHPNDPNDITAIDLHALTLMKVEVLGGGTRRLLEGSTHRPAILAALADVEHKDLLVAGPQDFLAMEKLYLAVRDVLSEPDTKIRNAWVTASKLCARKRYALFPVRDAVVCTYLGLIKGSTSSYKIDYQVYRALIGDRDITDPLDELADQLRAGIPDRDVRADVGRLRLLDAALWMYAPKRARR